MAVPSVTTRAIASRGRTAETAEPSAVLPSAVIGLTPDDDIRIAHVLRICQPQARLRVGAALGAAGSCWSGRQRCESPVLLVALFVAGAPASLTCEVFVRRAGKRLCRQVPRECNFGPPTAVRFPSGTPS